MAWFVLTIWMVGVLTTLILELVGVNNDFPLWQNLVALTLVVVVLQALLTAPTRPRPEVQNEIVRQWPLILAGLAMLVVLLSTEGDADPGAREEATSLVGFRHLHLAVLRLASIPSLQRQKNDLPSVRDACRRAVTAATSTGQRNTSSSFSEGVIQPRVCRGRR